MRILIRGGARPLRFVCDTEGKWERRHESHPLAVKDSALMLLEPHLNPWHVIVTAEECFARGHPKDFTYIN